VGERRGRLPPFLDALFLEALFLDAPGEALADPGRGGGHDVEVARVRRQEVAGPLDLDEHRDAGKAAGHRRGAVELRLDAQPVPGDVGGHLGGDLADRRGDDVGVRVRRDSAEDGVPHQHRRLGRVEDDDRLARSRPADDLHAAGGGPGELIDVRPCSRAR
jgi:hypothetical protein